MDRTSKFAFVELVQRADMQAASAFLQALVDGVPYRINTVLADNGIQFADLPRNRQGPTTARWRGYPFDRVCHRHGIEHRPTKPNHPWTNGQVERMNRTMKETTVQRYHYDNHGQLRTYLADFVAAYNFAKRLKTLQGLTSYEYICKLWTQQPHRLDSIQPIQCRDYTASGTGTSPHWLVRQRFEGSSAAISWASPAPRGAIVMIRIDDFARREWNECIHVANDAARFAICAFSTHKCTTGAWMRCAFRSDNRKRYLCIPRRQASDCG